LNPDEPIFEPPHIGRYEVIQELGRGGMGVVYLGRDPFIDRPVAIKTSTTPPPSDPEAFEKFRQAFFHEARAAGNLKHPNIVSVYDAMVQDNQCYLVMEYIDGKSLRDYHNQEPSLSISNIVKILFQCAKALEYAHEHGVIHRDIKPANIMITQSGEIKISDFGIASVEGTSASSPSEETTGSIYYLSPEQLHNKPLVSQSDIFALGVVAYELLTGVRPFAADNAITTIFKIINEDPAPISDHRQDVPESLQRIVARCLEKEPDKRYQTGQHLATDLVASHGHLRFLEEELNFEKKFNAIKKLDFFNDFSSSEMVEILKATQWYKYSAAMTIISEGEVDNVFYIIVSGEVTVKKKGKTLARLKTGDCFGEMAYMGHAKRTATIMAVVDTVVMKINSTFIAQTSTSTQLRFYKVFNYTLIRRLAETSELLTQTNMSL